MDARTFWNSFSSAGRVQPQPAASLSQGFSEADIPAEWRNDLFRNYGEVIEPSLSDEESAVIELDRR